jgi:hypothetical protein
MAKRATSIPSYRRKRKGRRGFTGWLWRIVLALFLFSFLWVLAYRFIDDRRPGCRARPEQGLDEP